MADESHWVSHWKSTDRLSVPKGPCKPWTRKRESCLSHQPIASQMALAMNTMNITATACILAVDLGKYKSVACLYPWVKMGYAIIPPNPDEEIPVNEATRA